MCHVLAKPVTQSRALCTVSNEQWYRSKHVYFGSNDTMVGYIAPQLRWLKSSAGENMSGFERASPTLSCLLRLASLGTAVYCSRSAAVICMSPRQLPGTKGLLSLAGIPHKEGGSGLATTVLYQYCT